MTLIPSCYVKNTVGIKEIIYQRMFYVLLKVASNATLFCIFKLIEYKMKYFKRFCLFIESIRYVV